MEISSHSGWDTTFYRKKKKKNHIIKLVQKSAQTPSTTKENFTNRDKPIAKTKNKGKQ